MAHMVGTDCGTTCLGRDVAPVMWGSIGKMDPVITAMATIRAKANAVSWRVNAFVTRSVMNAVNWNAKVAQMMNDDDDVDVWAAFSESEPMPVRMLYPKTVEGMLESLQELRHKHETLEKIPYKDSLIPTHSFFEDLCNRLLALEKGDRDGQ